MPKTKNLQTFLQYLRSQAPQKYAEGGSVEEEDSMDRLRARLREIEALFDYTKVGLQSQMSGINPHTGESEFSLLNPLLSLTGTDLRHIRDPEFKALVEEQMAQLRDVPIGLVEETKAIPSLAELWGGDYPEWAGEAAEEVAANRAKLYEDYELPPPEGFPQHAAEMAGVMLGQAPVPALWFKNLKNIIRKSGPLGQTFRWLTAPVRAGIEYLSPIVEPKIGAYIAGALFGGSIGTFTDPGEIPPDIENLVQRAKEGDEEARSQLLALLREYQGAQAEEAIQAMGSKETPAHFASGGKVNRLTELLKEIK